MIGTGMQNRVGGHRPGARVPRLPLGLLLGECIVLEFERYFQAITPIEARSSR
jgi:hypothetical protein